jgi:hypothetical protein
MGIYFGILIGILSGSVRAAEWLGGGRLSFLNPYFLIPILNQALWGIALGISLVYARRARLTNIRTMIVVVSFVPVNAYAFTVFMLVLWRGYWRRDFLGEAFGDELLIYIVALLAFTFSTYKIGIASIRHPREEITREPLPGPEGKGLEQLPKPEMGSGGIPISGTIKIQGEDYYFYRSLLYRSKNDNEKVGNVVF